MASWWDKQDKYKCQNYTVGLAGTWEGALDYVHGNFMHLYN